MDKRARVSSYKIVRNILIALAVLFALVVLVARNLPDNSAEPRLNQQLWQNGSPGSPGREPDQTSGATRLKHQLEQERAGELERMRMMATRVHLAEGTRVP